MRWGPGWGLFSVWGRHLACLLANHPRTIHTPALHDAHHTHISIFFLFSFSFFFSLFLFPFSFFLPPVFLFLFLFFFKTQIACTAFVTRLADGAGMAACDGCDCDAYGDGSQRWRLSWDRVQQSNSISNLCFLLLALVAVHRVCPGRASTEWNFPNTTPLILSTARWTPIRSNPIHFNWLA